TPFGDRLPLAVAVVFDVKLTILGEDGSVREEHNAGTTYDTTLLDLLYKRTLNTTPVPRQPFYIAREGQGFAGVKALPASGSRREGGGPFAFTLSNGISGKTVPPLYEGTPDALSDFYGAVGESIASQRVTNLPDFLSPLPDDPVELRNAVAGN